MIQPATENLAHLSQAMLDDGVINLSMLSSGTAAPAGIGLVLLWRDWHGSLPAGWRDSLDLQDGLIPAHRHDACLLDEAVSLSQQPGKRAGTAVRLLAWTIQAL